MAKDIEKLIEEFVIPEMEYSPSYEKKTKGKAKTQTVTIDEIPEVVLPKTKQQVYQEAKGRLEQKTSAVSRKKKTDTRSEVAATNTLTNRKTTSPRTVTMTKAKPAEPRTVALGVSLVAEPVWVGSAEELVPFSWRMPLLPDLPKPSKFYRQAVSEAKELLLPVPHNNK